jgi:hypothetical protein
VVDTVIRQARSGMPDPRAWPSRAIRMHRRRHRPLNHARILKPRHLRATEKCPAEES